MEHNLSELIAMGFGQELAQAVLENVANDVSCILRPCPQCFMCKRLRSRECP